MIAKLVVVNSGMKLYELTGIKHLKGTTPDKFYELLKSGNLKFLGNGSNGVAITDGKHAWKLWHRDTAYEEFIKAAKKIGGPWLPEFFGEVKTFKEIIHTDTVSDNGKWRKVFGDVRYIKMELLSKFVGEQGFKLWTDKTVLDWIEVNAEYPDIANFITLDALFDWSSMGDNARGMISEFLYHHAEDCGIHEKRYLEKHIEKINPQVLAMAAVMSKLAKELDFSKHRIDWNAGNVMLRGSQIVITDPYANDEDISANRELMADLKFQIKSERENKS